MSDSCPTFNIESILAKAREAEEQFNLEALSVALTPVWNNITTVACVTSLTELEQAEIYKFIGYLHLFFGQATGSAEKQIQGKKYLEKSLPLYEKLQVWDEVYNVRNFIAYYHNERGEFQLAEQILDKCVQHYSQDNTHYNYIYAQIVRMMVLRYEDKLNLAESLIRVSSKLMNEEAPIKLLMFFYNQAGAVYQALKRFDESLIYYGQAHNCAKILKNKRSAAYTKHLIAKTFVAQNKYVEAIEILNKALSISRRLDDYGWLAHFTATEAEIHYKVNDLQRALPTINKSIFYFRSGQDNIGYAAALWLKIEILAKLYRVDELEDQFSNLIEHVNKNCDQKVQNLYFEKYKEKFSYLNKIKTPDQTIYRLNYDQPNILKSTTFTFFSVPEELAQKMFGVRERVVVETEKALMLSGEYAIFLLDGKYACGQLVKENGWYLRELMTFTLIPIESVTHIRKIGNYSSSF